jgi:hypothetical protein
MKRERRWTSQVTSSGRRYFRVIVIVKDLTNKQLCLIRNPLISCCVTRIHDSIFWLRYWWPLAGIIVINHYHGETEVSNCWVVPDICAAQRVLSPNFKWLFSVESNSFGGNCRLSFHVVLSYVHLPVGFVFHYKSLKSLICALHFCWNVSPSWEYPVN